MAEDDTRLLAESARVEVSVFSELLWDRVDTVRGTKGSGKTAMYRIFADMLAPLLAQGSLSDKRIVVLRGVEVTGDPIFKALVIMAITNPSDSGRQITSCTPDTEVLPLLHGPEF